MNNDIKKWFEAATITRNSGLFWAPDSDKSRRRNRNAARHLVAWAGAEVPVHGMKTATRKRKRRKKKKKKKRIRRNVHKRGGCEKVMDIKPQ